MILYYAKDLIFLSCYILLNIILLNIIPESVTLLSDKSLINISLYLPGFNDNEVVKSCRAESVVVSVKIGDAEFKYTLKC